jgi:hypothetical protein
MLESRANALADSSAGFYKHVQSDLGFDLKLRWAGYLWLFDEDGYRRMLPVLEDLANKGFQYKEYISSLRQGEDNAKEITTC